MKKIFKNKKACPQCLKHSFCRWGFIHQNFIKKISGGFTIVETLFGISIFILIVLALTLFSKNIWSYNSFISAGLTDADVAKQTLKTMSAEIRTASPSDTGTYTINLANSSSFTFYSDIDDDGLKEKVRYFISGASSPFLLKKGVVKPTGSPLGYTGVEVLSTIASYVTSNSVFQYYDKNYTGTEAPLSSPINISSIRLVKITVTIDKDVNRPPAPMTFSTQISMRNLKDNL